MFALLPVLSLPLIPRTALLRAPQPAGSAHDLINAVNALRASNGLPAYGISSILMYTAQNQAAFMAATGLVSHSGPGGISLTDRLLAAGYPLAGDLSLGGFRAENITSGDENMTAEAAVNQWTGDAPHLNTMLSPNLTEIGAGVAVANGRVYYVIDAARPTASGAPQVVTPSLGGGSAVPAGEALVPVVIISTPNASGEVIHEVLPGQTLWQIAVSYDVRIDEIKRLNDLSSDMIFPGEKLLIEREAGPTAGSPAEISTVAPTSTSTPTVSPSPASTRSFTAFTLTPPVSTSAQPASAMIMGAVLGIIALALFGGGVFAWLGSAKKE
ncbi:MAG: CAP domain-containing protein [Anaerolineales bacterium]|nr:CAP domain-containing protein [Anaerolineales bacterium]